MKFQKLTPNLVVNDVQAAMTFYRNVLSKAALPYQISPHMYSDL